MRRKERKRCVKCVMSLVPARANRHTISISMPPAKGEVLTDDARSGLAGMIYAKVPVPSRPIFLLEPPPRASECTLRTNQVFRNAPEVQREAQHVGWRTQLR